MSRRRPGPPATHDPPTLLPQTLYIFSPTLVPPARDWQRSITVTGALRPPPPGGRAAPLAAASAEDAEAAEQLPAGLRVYIADAK